MAEKSEPSFEEAVAADWENAFDRDFAVMTPIQKLALERSREKDRRKSVEAAHDGDRKISRMSRSEFERYSADAIYEADLAKAGK
jgi:hypothetical protein